MMRTESKEGRQTLFPALRTLRSTGKREPSPRTERGLLLLLLQLLGGGGGCAKKPATDGLGREPQPLSARTVAEQGVVDE